MLKLFLVTTAVLPQQGTVVEYAFGEFPERQGWQPMWVLLSNEILIEPMCLLDLEAYPRDRNELFGGYVDDKATTSYPSV